MSIYTVEPAKLIQSIAEKLKEYPEIVPPEGSRFWKIAFFKELAPVEEDFWYIRCASLLRKINKFGEIGVNRLRKKYGGRNRKGSGLNHSAKASGKIIRVALQQLEKANLIKSKKGARGGYSLGRKPSKIKIGEIIRALEGNTGLVKCMALGKKGKYHCPRERKCLTKNFWKKIQDSLNSALNSITLADLVKNQ